MNAIINERAHKGVMIYYTNIQLQISLQKCYMYIHKCLTPRHDYSFGTVQCSIANTLKDSYEKVCAIGQVSST
jgi:hypothetical protein